MSDRDTQFASHLWRSLQSSLGTKLKFSIAYRPQIDRQSERTIQTLEDILRAYMLDFKGSWEDHLHLVEFSCNNSFRPVFRGNHMKFCTGGNAGHQCDEMTLVRGSFWVQS